MRKAALPLFALGLVACGPMPGNAVPGAGAGPVSGPPPISAALVTPGFGWILTPDRLLVTRDGGATFIDARLPLPAGTARAVVFTDADNGFAAAANGTVIAVARTSDGGRTWSTLTTPGDATLGAYGALRIAFGDARRGVILAQAETSSVFSKATLLATADGGASWSAHAAPTAGEVAVEPGGRTWLAGGLTGSELFSSADQGLQWTPSRIHLSGSVVSATVAPPVDDILPVTVVTTADTTEVAMLASADNGATWRERGRIPVAGRTGAGVREPVASVAGIPTIFDTVGGRAYQMSRSVTAAPTSSAPAMSLAVTSSAAGLPEGVTSVTFAKSSRFGWALATYGRCQNGKKDCALYYPLLSTDDGGASWRQLAMWTDQLN